MFLSRILFNGRSIQDEIIQNLNIKKFLFLTFVIMLNGIYLNFQLF